MNNGYWWCPHCAEGVDGSRVTWQEAHDSCGHTVEWVDLVESPIERIGKLESLARELARELEEIKRRGDWLKRDCTEPDKVISYAIDINIIGNGTLAKAKEVLGDGN